jgi:outer membrane protein OmpA-like peptidoglycan-associated protein
MKTLRAFFSVAGLIGMVTVAQAQQAPGFGVNRFEPAERGSEWFVLESLDLRGHLRPAVGVVGEYQYKPLVIYNSDGSERSAVVNHLFVVHPGGSLVLWDRLRFGFSIPIQAYANGEGGILAGAVYAPPSAKSAIGDIRFGADVRLLGTFGDALTLAVGAQVALPTGDREAYAGDGAVRVAPRLLVAGEMGPVVYAAKVGWQYRRHSVDYGDAPVGSELLFAGAVGLRVLDRKLVFGPEVYGSSVSEDFFKKRTTPVEGIFGGHYTAGDFRFGAGFGGGLSRGFGTPVIHALASLEWTPGGKVDRDKDGILDAVDRCPDVYGVASKDVLQHGCPEAPAPIGPVRREVDRDNDGILDGDDFCPDVPGVSSPTPKQHGCPAPVEVDSDRDGVLERDDACPKDPGLATGDRATHGCPDGDQDGIVDSSDACPTVVGVASADATRHGCPEERDRDKDGILDKEDGCPDEAGPKSDEPRRNGCPAAFVQDGQIKILDRVRFKTGSHALERGRESLDVLEAVLNVLKQHPEIVKVRVEGHTDNRGSSASNQRLSARRAAAVVKWLVDQGLERARFTSAGFGPDRPVETNDTEEGRHKNRRVEFHIEKESK